MPEDAAAETARPRFVIGITGRSFVRVSDAELVSCIEVVIDLGIDLFAAESVQGRNAVGIRTEYALGATVFIPAPAIAGRALWHRGQ